MRREDRLTSLDAGGLLLSRVPSERGWETACIYLPMGSRFEPASKNGITHLLEHFFFSAEGEGMTAHERIEGLGGVLWTQTDREYCAIGATALNATATELFSLLQQFLGEVDLSRFEQIREMVAGEIVQREMGPTSLLYEGVHDILFAPHSLHRPIVGRPDTVLSLTRDDLSNFCAANYCQERAVFVALSRQNPTEIQEQVGQLLGPTPTVPSPLKLDLTLHSPSMVRTVRYKRTLADLPDVFFSLALAFPHGAATDSAYSMGHLAMLLAGCRGSRLYRRLHYEVATGYQLNARPVFYSDCGFVLVTGRVPCEKVIPLINNIFSELRHIAVGGASAEESERIHQFLRYTTAVHLEDQQNQAIWISRELYLNGTSYDPHERLASRKASPALLAEAAETLLNGPRSAVVIQPELGPSEAELVEALHQ